MSGALLCRGGGLARTTVSGVGTFERHFCPDCDWLFPEDLHVIKCARCASAPAKKDKDGKVIKPAGRYNSEGKPLRVAHYFPIADHITAAFATKGLAKHAKYGWERPAPTEANMTDRELQDIWDGKIMHELFYNPDPRITPLRTLYFLLSFDGVEVKKKVYYTHIHDRTTYGIPFVSLAAYIVAHYTKSNLNVTYDVRCTTRTRAAYDVRYTHPAHRTYDVRFF